MSKLLDEREKTHGIYALQSYQSQRIKECFRGTTGWARLDPIQKDALEMIAVKVSRILTGNNRHIDHWDDVSGYAERVVRYYSGFNKTGE